AEGTLDLLRRVESEDALQKLFRRAGEMIRDLEARGDSKLAKPQAAALLRQLERETRRYQMQYDLTLSEKPGVPSHRLNGSKQTVGSPSATAPWTETTTLSFTLTPVNGGGSQSEKGTLRVHMADLLTRQVPSFNVTGTTDDIRVAWAFGRFFRFFFGVLRRVYLPHVHLPDPLSERS